MQKLSTFLALSITTLLVGLFVTACATIYPVVPQADADARHAAQTAEAVVVPTPTIEPTAVAIATEEADDQSCDIKLNIASNGDMIYHMPDGAYYSRVRIDLDNGEGYACTEAEAIGLGFRKSAR